MNFIILGKACSLRVVRLCWKKVRVVCVQGGERERECARKAGQGRAGRARRRDLDKGNGRTLGLALEYHSVGDCVHGNPGDSFSFSFFLFSFIFAGTWVKGGMYV